MRKEYFDPPRLPARTYRQLDEIDTMPPKLRGCVHDYGYSIVKAFLQRGITDPATIRYLVKEVWDGARQPQQNTSASYNSTMRHLDWLLIQAGAKVSAATLARFLHDHSWTFAPINPTVRMVTASLGEVSGFNEVMTKQDKHRRRLEAALKACSKSLFTHLYTNEQLKGDAA